MSILHKVYSGLSDEPLFLPRGSVRAIIALTAIGTWVYLTISGLSVSKEFYTILGAIIAWYFSARENDKEREMVAKQLEEWRTLYMLRGGEEGSGGAPHG